MDEKIELAQERDFGQQINDTFVFLVENWKPLFKSVISISGVFIITGVISTVLFQLQMIDMAENVRNGAPIINPFTAIFNSQFMLSMLAGIFGFLTIVLSSFSFIVLVREKSDAAPTLREIWGYCKYYFWRFIGLGATLFLLWIVIFFTVGIAISIVGAFISPFLAFLIFGLMIYLWPVFSLTMPIMVFENGSIFYSIQKSFKIIKSNWWTTFGALVITCITVYAGIIFLYIPIAALSKSALIVSGGESKVLLIVLQSVIQIICPFLMTVPCILLSLSYFNLVEKKEGISLIGKLAKLTSIEQPAASSEEEY